MAGGEWGPEARRAGEVWLHLPKPVRTRPGIWPTGRLVWSFKAHGGQERGRRESQQVWAARLTQLYMAFGAVRVPDSFFWCYQWKAVFISTQVPCLPDHRNELGFG